jgi:polysaccharide chain length determinant protein (PEP-CTERM system associated)
MSHDPFSAATDEPVLQRAWAMLRRRRLLAAVVSLTLAASAAGFAKYLPDLYQASALVLVERQMSEAVARPTANGELENRLQVIKQEILSRARLTELIEKFNLYAPLRRHSSMETALDQTRRDIQIETTGPEQVNGRTKTVAFRLIYTGEDRDTVAAVTNALAAFYVAQNDRMRSEEATRTAAFLNGRLIDAKKELDHYEENVRAFTAQHVVDLPQQTGVTLASITRLNDQLRLNGEQQLNVMEQRQRLLEGVTLELQAQNLTSTAAPQLSGDPADLPRRISRMKDDLQQLETKSTARHPDVIRMKEQLAGLEREAAARDDAEQKAAAAPGATPEPSKDLPPARRRALEHLDGELARLKQTEIDSRAGIAGFERRLEGVPAVQQAFQVVSRDQQAAKEQYDSLMKRYDEAQLVASMETDRQGERFRVLETAIPPEGPKAPNRLRLLLMGLLLAAGAAAAAVLASEQMDSSFHSLDELRRFTRVPVLASIPAIDSAAGRRRAYVVVAVVSALVVIGLAGAASARYAHGNEQLVRLLARTSS